MALENVDIEAICLSDKARILCVEFGQAQVAVRRRPQESGKFKLELVIRADHDVEMRLAAVREMLNLTGEERLERSPLD